MANTDTPFGMKPIQTPYGGLDVINGRIAASYAQNIWPGMPVVKTTDGTFIRATAGAGNYIYGVCVGVEDADRVPQKYFASGTAEVYKIYVTNDPDQLFLMQEDAAASTLTQAAEGALIDFIGYGGNTTTGQSTCEIDSSSLSGSSLNQLRIMKLSDEITNESGSSWSKWIVKIEYSQNRASQLGAAI